MGESADVNVQNSSLDTGDPVSLVLADCVLRENFRRAVSQRSFTNQALLDKLIIPEFDLAAGLLQQVVDLYNRAGIAYANFGGKIGQASQMRISLGLSQMRLDRVKAAKLKVDQDRMKLDAAGLPPQGV